MVCVFARELGREMSHHRVGVGQRLLCLLRKSLSVFQNESEHTSANPVVVKPHPVTELVSPVAQQLRFDAMDEFRVVTPGDTLQVNYQG